MRGLTNFIRPAFEGDNGKASAPKITAFWFCVLVTMLHVWWLKKAFMTGEFNLLTEILYGDEATIITLLGLKVWERVKTNKDNGDNDKSPTI